MARRLSSVHDRTDIREIAREELCADWIEQFGLCMILKKHDAFDCA